MREGQKTLGIQSGPTGNVGFISFPLHALHLFLTAPFPWAIHHWPDKSSRPNGGSYLFTANSAGNGGMDFQFQFRMPYFDIIPPFIRCPILNSWEKGPIFLLNSEEMMRNGPKIFDKGTKWRGTGKEKQGFLMGLLGPIGLFSYLVDPIIPDLSIEWRKLQLARSVGSRNFLEWQKRGKMGDGNGGREWKKWRGEWPRLLNETFSPIPPFSSHPLATA